MQARNNWRPSDSKNKEHNSSLRTNIMTLVEEDMCRRWNIKPCSETEIES